MNNRIWDSFLRGFGRSIGWKLGALVLLAVLGLFGMGNARAANIFNSDQGRAYQACMKPHANGWTVHSCTPQTLVNCSVFGQPDSNNNPPHCGYFKQLFQCGPNVCTGDNYGYKSDATCSNRADLVGLSVHNFQGGSNICNFGCEYGQTTPQADTTITDASNPQNSLRFGVLLGGKATGAVCTRNDGRDKPPEPGDEPPQCLTVGQDSNGPIQHCPKPDGGSCLVTGKGTKFCQPPPPNTEGPKTDTGRQEGISQSTDQNSPPQPPANRPGENWQPTSSSTVTNNITNNTSNHNSYGNAGTPNPNGSPVPGDGSGPNGAGQQEGSGTGTGPGTGTGGTGEGTDMGPTNAILDGIRGSLEGDDGAAGGFGSQVDGIGTGDETPPDDDTSDPFDGMKETRNSSWFLDQLDDAGFLGGGSCPSDQSVSVGAGSFQLSLAPLCQLLSAISGLVMAVAYIIAFRIMAT